MACDGEDGFAAIHIADPSNLTIVGLVLAKQLNASCFERDILYSFPYLHLFARVHKAELNRNPEASSRTQPSLRSPGQLRLMGTTRS